MKIAQVQFQTLVDEGFIVEEGRDDEEVTYKPHEDYIICVAEGAWGYNKQCLTSLEYKIKTAEVDLWFVSDAGNDVCRTFHQCVYLELGIYKNIAEKYEDSQ